MPPGTMRDQYPRGGCEGDNLVPGCSLQYGLDLTVYLAVIDDPERMSSKLGCEVHVEASRNVAHQRIKYWMRKKHAQNAWAPTRKTFHVVEARAPTGSYPVPYNQPKSLGKKVTSVLAVT